MFFEFMSNRTLMLKHNKAHAIQPIHTGSMHEIRLLFVRLRQQKDAKQSHAHLFLLTSEYICLWGDWGSISFFSLYESSPCSLGAFGWIIEG
jgi:hypothetical protein